MLNTSFSTIRYKNKAVFAVILAFTLLINGFFSVAMATESATPSGYDPTLPIVDGGPEIESTSAVVMDVNSGAILFAKNPTTALQPSSLTKLVTALVCFDELSLNDPVVFSANASSQDFPTASNAGFRNGETTDVKSAITGMLMCSADDCAVALAEKAKGDEEAFAELLNSYAATQGYKNTHFVNSNGVHNEKHYTCSFDMALAATNLMKNYPEYKAIVSGVSTTLSASGSSLSTLTIKNTHRFIKGTDSYSYCYAGKTGGMAYGGDGTWSLCTYASKGGMNLVCIIMGAPSNDATYSDTKTLFDYAFTNYVKTSALDFINSGQEGLGTLFNENTAYNPFDTSSIFTDSNAYLVLPMDAKAEQIKSEISFTQIHEFVYGNNIIGSMNFYYNDRLAGSADIIFYTENASLTQDAFNQNFPSFLISPDTTQGNNFYSDFGDSGITKKPGFFDKIIAALLSLYTPAKTFALICTVLIFIIGVLIITMVFPVKLKQKDKLYRKEYDKFKTAAPDDELSEIHTKRRSDVEDMHEIK